MKDVINIIEATIQYIEKNLLRKMDLDEISDNVFVSKYHLLRLFKNITGFGIMEYIILRRLSLSVNALLYTKKNMEYIAGCLCFSGSQAYIRAFRRTFSVTPTAFRKNPRELLIYEPYNIELLKRIGNGCVVMPDIKIVPAFRIAGMEHKVNVYRNRHKSIGMKLAYDFFFNKRKFIKNASSYSKYIGYSRVPRDFTNTGVKRQYVYYMPSIIINEGALVPGTMKTVDIETGKYAVFKYVGFHGVERLSGTELFEVWEYILFQWMLTVDYKEDGSYCFEWIDYELCEEDYCEIKFYLPVK